MKDNGWKGLLAFLLVGMAVVGVLGAVSNGFTNWPKLPTSAGSSSSSGSSSSGSVSSSNYNSVKGIGYFYYDTIKTKSDYSSGSFTVDDSGSGDAVIYANEKQMHVFTAVISVTNSSIDPGFMTSNGFKGTNTSSSDSSLLNFIRSMTNVPNDFEASLITTFYDSEPTGIYYTINLVFGLPSGSSFSTFIPSILIDGQSNASYNSRRVAHAV